MGQCGGYLKQCGMNSGRVVKESLCCLDVRAEGRIVVIEALWKIEEEDDAR
jgi:hypothetical protein